MDDSTNDGFCEYMRIWGENAARDAGLDGSIPLMPTTAQTALLRVVYDRETAFA